MTFGRDSNDKFEMQVPDRILVAGGDQHIAAKSTPFEMQVENAVLPPTRHEVRVNTPPRSIRLDEHNFPSAQSEEEDDEAVKRPAPEDQSRSSSARRSLKSAITPIESESMFQRHASDPSVSMMEASMHHGGSGHSMNPWDEIQMVRRQIAKLNHRLMAVELENQQQQQREMILTVMMSCYFVGKFFMWLNRGSG